MGVPSLMALRQALFLSLILAAGCAHEGAPVGVWVHSLTIKGNKTLSSRTVRKRLATESSGWWPLASHKPFDVAAFDLDLKRIPALYADNGFFDARIMNHQVLERNDKSVDVIIWVDEGKPTTIREVLMGGFPSPEHAKRVEQLARQRDVVVGQVINYEDYRDLKTRAENSLKEAGYAYGKIISEITVDRDLHAANVSLQAVPGPLVHMGQATIEGNGNIPKLKLLRRVTWIPGDLYDPGDISATQGRLYNLGVFSSVQLELPPTPTETVPVVIRVSPGKLRELKLGGGFGVERQREEIRLRASWTRSNFLGGLRKLRLRAKTAYVVIPNFADIERHGPAANADAELVQPDIFRTNANLRGVLGYDLLITEGYQAQGPRTSIGVDRPFLHDRLQAGAAWNLQFFDFFNLNTSVFNSTSTSLGFGFKDPYRLAFAEEFVQLDLRDRPLDPTFGGYASIRFEQGSPYLGGDFRYLKFTPELRLYFPLGRRIVIATRGLVGWLNPLGGGIQSDSPITRRYQQGGPSGHRGFTFGRLSPQIADDKGRLIPVGGDGEVLVSAEVRVDIVQLADQWLGVAVFCDAGDVTVHFSDLDLMRLHYAVGASLEYDTPIGTVRFGLGVRVNRLEGVRVAGEAPQNPDPGQRFAFHLTLGEAF